MGKIILNKGPLESYLVKSQKNVGTKVIFLLTKTYETFTVQNDIDLFIK